MRKTPESGGFRCHEKIAVTQSRQSCVSRRLAIRPGQIVPKSLIKTFVNQNPHLGTGEQKVLRFFEGSDRRFTGYCGKALQEIFECFAASQVVE